MHLTKPISVCIWELETITMYEMLESISHDFQV